MVKEIKLGNNLVVLQIPEFWIDPACAQKHFWNSSFEFPINHILLSKNTSSYFQLVTSPFILDFSIFITPQSCLFYLFNSY